MFKKLTLALIATTASVCAVDVENISTAITSSQQTVEWKTGHTEQGRRGLKKITKTEVWQGPKVTQTLTLSWNEQGSPESKSLQLIFSYLTGMSQFWTPDNNLPQINEQDVTKSTITDVTAKAAEWKLTAQTQIAGLGYSDQAHSQLQTLAFTTIDALATQIKPTTMEYKKSSQSDRIWSEAKRIEGQSADAWKKLAEQTKELAKDLEPKLKDAAEVVADAVADLAAEIEAKKKAAYHAKAE